jgi:uncharacterized protein (DUF4415 family)
MTNKERKDKDLEEFPEPQDWSRAVRRSAEAGKTSITIRIDNDVLEWFRAQVESAGGGNYQSNMNAALRSHMMSESGAFERAVRKAIRDELEAAGIRGRTRAPVSSTTKKKAKKAARSVAGKKSAKRKSA